MTPLARFRLAVALLSILGTWLASAQELRNDDEDITQTRRSRFLYPGQRRVRTG